MLDFKEASNTDLTETQNTDLTEFPHYSKTPREIVTGNNCHKLQQNLQGERTLIQIKHRYCHPPSAQEL